MHTNHQYEKTFIIDTNVFIHRPDAILSFKESEVIVPLWVLEELDKLKTFSDERGRNARHAIRFMEERAKKGDLSQGVKIEEGSLLRVEMTYDPSIAPELSHEKNDNKIILCGLTLQQKGDRNVFFVSKDINARVKARGAGDCIRWIMRNRRSPCRPSILGMWRHRSHRRMLICSSVTAACPGMII